MSDSEWSREVADYAINGNHATHCHSDAQRLQRWGKSGSTKDEVGDTPPPEDLPMPGVEEVERQFAITLVCLSLSFSHWMPRNVMQAELNLPEDKVGMVKNLPLETKWRMVCE